MVLGGTGSTQNKKERHWLIYSIYSIGSILGAQLVFILTLMALKTMKAQSAVGEHLHILFLLAFPIPMHPHTSRSEHYVPP